MRESISPIPSSKGKMPLGMGKMPQLGKIGGMSKMHGFGRKKRLK